MGFQTTPGGKPRVYPRYQVVVKGSPEKGELGDCPFSQRVLLTLEEKNVPYQKILLDEYNMPEWISKVNPEGKIPVLLDLEHLTWHPESNDIVELIEKEYPEPKLAPSKGCNDVIQGVFPAFTEFLKAEGSQTQEKEAALRKELQAINDHINKSGGPFLSGDHICGACLALAPRLYHLKVATKAIKGWELPSEYSALHNFLAAIQQRQSWKNTAPTEKYVIDGWKQKISS